ncbi:lysosome membrane protein 2-like isoform X2 [Folsomia candida]|uniref:lysosome membrane protein 2-like isoform X2 n=1 Tax=Folsomia candida TaxID=158441 RepID=UPI00160540AE|nr:lysosome membrane protein 2-like isoform X2 [Folsomia candida]
MQMRDLLQSEEFLKLIVIFGAVCTLGSIALGWGGLELGITLVIRKTTKLSPGSTLWENWKNGDAHIKFYLFNITNPEEVATKKVELNEIGPFVYLVEFDKLNMDKNKKIDTILYSPTRTYYFQADKSSGKESDLITFINVPYVAMSHIANDAANSENNNIPEMVDRILTEKGEKLIRTDTVKNFLFDGISVQAYVDLMNDLLVDQESENIHLPEHFKDGLFAIFKGKNGTKDGRWECHSGNRNYADIGKLVSYNGQSRLNLYKDSSCNAINGTDGWIYPPFIEPGEKDLYIFLPELCRSVRWEFVKMTQVEGGIPVARHRFPQIKTFAEDPQVWCFCPKTNVSACDIHGIANLEQCFDVDRYSCEHQYQNAVLNRTHPMGINAKLQQSTTSHHTIRLGRNCVIIDGHHFHGSSSLVLVVETSTNSANPRLARVAWNSFHRVLLGLSM